LKETDPTTRMKYKLVYTS